MTSRKSKTASEAEPKWERTPREVDALEKMLAGRFEGVPRLKISKSEDGSGIITEHMDNVAGLALNMEAIATTDADFFAGIVGQLSMAEGGEPDEQKLNFMLAVVKGIKPRDQQEAMLGAQMAVVHSHTMRFSRKLADADFLSIGIARSEPSTSLCELSSARWRH
jgi:hypothetical protein